VNVLFLWDYECAFLLEEWKSKYSHLAEQWFAAVGEFESLLCLVQICRGKLHFCRRLGSILCYPVPAVLCAEQMNCSQFNIMTSMRIADDLNEGVSTFYAELKRIKGIVDFAHKRPNMIFLINEIFRGTNSVDRLNGAKT